MSDSSKPDNDVAAFRKRYVNYFRTQYGVQQYQKFRDIVDHRTLCARSLSENIKKRGINIVSLLDIGTGDGKIFNDIIFNLTDRGKQASVTAIEPSVILSSQATATLSHLNPTIVCNDLSESLLLLGGSRFGLILAVHSLYALTKGEILQIAELIDRKGVFDIWMSTRNNNVLSEVCGVVRSDRRHYAEDIVKYFRSDKIVFDVSIRKFSWFIDPLLDGNEINERGRAVVDFLSLNKSTEDLIAVASKAAIKCAYRKGNKIIGHPVTDMLIEVTRREP